MRIRRRADGLSPPSIRLEKDGDPSYPYMERSVMSSSKVRVGTVDAGNCASSFVQGLVIDAVRYAEPAMDRKIGGALTGPPQQFTDNEARERTNRFVNGDEA